MQLLNYKNMQSNQFDIYSYYFLNILAFLPFQDAFALRLLNKKQIKFTQIKLPLVHPVRPFMVYLGNLRRSHFEQFILVLQMMATELRLFVEGDYMEDKFHDFIFLLDEHLREKHKREKQLLSDDGAGSVEGGNGGGKLKLKLILSKLKLESYFKLESLHYSRDILCAIINGESSTLSLEGLELRKIRNEFISLDEQWARVIDTPEVTLVDCDVILIGQKHFSKLEKLNVNRSKFWAVSIINSLKVLKMTNLQNQDQHIRWANLEVLEISEITEIENARLTILNCQLFLLKIQRRIDTLQSIIIERKFSTHTFETILDVHDMFKDVPTYSLSLRTCSGITLTQLHNHFTSANRCTTYEVIKIHKAKHGMEITQDRLVVSFLREKGGPLHVKTTKYYRK
ncbi:hypothetical protein FGO68_gene334 [Halteria grandinella]|uniref:Uncharacterized protein n=1 Tax=Halteria grandinella TaxID=5974 RepID=A0A8J8NM29_HALGN|nr:hypothetical protein FGO68_gene334 [Halteria grandinella]